MKHWLAFFILVFAVCKAWSCDEALQPFPRDCSLQDRLLKLKADFQAKGIDIDEVAEYRVMRFIDRGSWEKAKSTKLSPMKIYEPAPATWEVWDSGIRRIFANPDTNFSDAAFSQMNRVLLMNDHDNIKDPNTDRANMPGDFRAGADLGIGFCHRNVRDSSEILAKASRSNLVFQKNWEQQTGVKFEILVRENGGINPSEAAFNFKMTQSENSNCPKPNSWVNFVPTAEVQQQLSWLLIFTGYNLQLIKEHRASMGPVALAAFVQRWFVTIHPFSDGNGRTSRAVQDVLLNEFQLPFAPAGDLYNDATTEWESYLEQTYKTMDSMLRMLEYCSTMDYTRPAAERAFYCATVEELNRL